jgi:iron complex outermembrane recepter protein
MTNRMQWIRMESARGSTLALSLICAAGAPASSRAQAVSSSAASAPAAQVVNVTAARLATPAFDLPASVDRVTLDPDGDHRPGINVSEALKAVPGLLARDRQNYAQDVQISVRGFGARSTFGIRGVRVYIDGVPATLPDGQGQISNVDLGSAASIEVLRGPFSALYGNSSGGVLLVDTEQGSGRPRLTMGAGGGSDGQLRYDAKLTGAQGGLDYVASTSRFHTDGYRAHSAVNRDIDNLKLGLRIDSQSKLTLVGNAIDMPDAQDPLGLTRAQLDAGSRGVDPSALQFNTRKSLNQTQAGLIYERRIGAGDTLRGLVYGGSRATEQFQSIPVATQANPLNPGGVIQLARDYEGADFRWTRAGTISQQRYSLVAGLAWDKLREHRRGYQNFGGSGPAPVLGVQGGLRRDEINDVTDLDPYLQGEWHPSAAWIVDAGVRRSTVKFESHDHHVVGTNPDDSGRARYAATLPVLGVLYAPLPDVHLYVTAGRGFETPTLNEIGYRPNGLTGLNFDLKPAHSNNIELGVKTRSSDWGAATLAVFATRTTDEIVTLSNVGGRSTYQNVASTRRLGAEFGWNKSFAGDALMQVSYTLLNAKYTGAFLSCTTTPCAIPSTQISAGNRMPGIPRDTLFMSMGWNPAQGWRGAVEARYVSSVDVNDTNSDAARSYAIASLSGGYLLVIGDWQVSAFARVDNLAGRHYVGSVIVNEGNGRYFEPAPGRTVFAGVHASFRF